MQMVLGRIVDRRSVVSISCRGVGADTNGWGMQGTAHLSRGLENKGTRPTLGSGRVLLMEFSLKSAEIPADKIYFIHNVRKSVQ
jgi:hypothetical protein